MCIHLSDSLSDKEKLIGAAIGITMVHFRLGRRAAFQLLQKTARNKRRKLAEISAEVVAVAETLSLNPGKHPD